MSDGMVRGLKEYFKEYHGCCNLGFAIWQKGERNESMFIDSDSNVICYRWNEIKRISGSFAISYGNRICGRFSGM